MYKMQGYRIDGREISMVFAKDRRKTSDEMRALDNPRQRDSRSRDRDYDR